MFFVILHVIKIDTNFITFLKIIKFYVLLVHIYTYTNLLIINNNYKIFDEFRHNLSSTRLGLNKIR